MFLFGCRYVAYPAIFARPGYGSLAPLVLGVTLFGVVSTGVLAATGPL